MGVDAYPYAAKPLLSRSRAICCRNAVIWFQLGVLGDASLRSHFRRRLPRRSAQREGGLSLIRASFGWASQRIHFTSGNCGLHA